MHPWRVLGIAPTEDSRAIKQAYARALKNTRPESDPEGYQRLRDCYEWALGWAERQRQEAADADREEDEPAAAAPRSSPENSRLDPAAPSAGSALNAVRWAAADGLPPEAGVGADRPPEAEERSAEPPGPQALLSSWHAFWQDHGDAALVEALPQLRRELALVPLEYGAHASALFAEWVVEHEDLPFPVLEALQSWFGWTRDFRAERVLGPELAAALHQRSAQHRLLRGTDVAATEHRAPSPEFQRHQQERRALPSKAQLTETFRPLSELKHRLHEQSSLRSLLFAMSLPGKLAGLLNDPLYAKGYLRIQLGEQGVAEQQRLFFVLHAIQLAGLGVLGFVLARFAALDYLASILLSAAAAAVALGAVGFAPLLLVPMDGALRAVREISAGPLEPGPVRSLLALLLSGLALAWSKGSVGAEPHLLSWLGLCGMALAIAWNPSSHWRALLVPAIGVSAFAIASYFERTVSTTDAISIALFGTVLWNLLCQRFGFGNRFAYGYAGILFLYQSLPLIFLAVLAQVGGWTVAGHAILMVLLILLPPTLFHLSSQQGLERVLAWLGFSVLMGPLLLADHSYLAIWLVSTPTLLWLLLHALAALGLAGAGPPPRRA